MSLVLFISQRPRVMKSESFMFSTVEAAAAILLAASVEATCARVRCGTLARQPGRWTGAGANTLVVFGLGRPLRDARPAAAAQRRMRSRFRCLPCLVISKLCKVHSVAGVKDP